MDISLGPLATESPCICILLFSSTIYSVGKCSGRVARKDMVYVPPPSHQNVTLDTATIQPGLHTFTVRLHFCYSSPNILPSTGGATSGHGAWRSNLQFMPESTLLITNMKREMKYQIPLQIPSIYISLRGDPQQN